MIHWSVSLTTLILVLYLEMYFCTSYGTALYCKGHKYTTTHLNKHTYCTALMWSAQSKNYGKAPNDPTLKYILDLFPLNFPARGLEVLVLDLSVPPKTSGIPPSLDQVPGLCLRVYLGLGPTAVRCVSVMHDFGSRKPFLTFLLLTCTAIQVQQIT